MKKPMLFLALAALVAACDMSGYTEYTTASYSEFEFTSIEFTDSLYLTSCFYGGSSSNGMFFYSARETDGGELTGGLGLSKKHNSSYLTKDLSSRPEFTMFASSAGWSSNTCAVYYQNPDESLMPEHDIVFYNYNYGTCSPYYIQIANTQQTVHDVLASDSEYQFSHGDYLKLTITGIAEGEKTGEIEYYLADYRTGTEAIDSVLTTWQAVMLESLGKIEYIDFNLESNVEGLPTSFCIDNLVTTVYMSY